MARRGPTALPPGSLRPSAVPRSRQVRHGLWSRARRSARHMPSRAHARPAPPFAGSLSRSPCPLSPLRPFPIPPIRPYSESEGLTTRSLDECAREGADLRRLCTPRGPSHPCPARNRASCVADGRRMDTRGLITCNPACPPDDDERTRPKNVQRSVVWAGTSGDGRTRRARGRAGGWPNEDGHRGERGWPNED